MAAEPTQELVVNGVRVPVADDRATLLEVLRAAGYHSVKDGCSPQGQCGCCTVLVDGAPRVSCVTPVRRVAGRAITTVEGLAPETAERWGEAFCATGGSQCGFCTPGIVLRLEGLRAKAGEPVGRDQLDRALAAHLCRCTGWQTIAEAAVEVGVADRSAAPAVYTPAPTAGRDLDAAARRAAIEGHADQRVAPGIALGLGGFAEDTAPADALVAVPDGQGGWVVGETLAAARAAAGKIQGRRTTVDPVPPIDVPDGDWSVVLRTSWVEPAYLETDASWAEPGALPASPLANGGAFGGKRNQLVVEAAKRLADEHGRPVRVVLSREDTVRLGAKRPPMAIALGADGSGVALLASLASGADRALAQLTNVFPAVAFGQVDLAGPPASPDLRATGWAELLVAYAGLSSMTGRPLPDPGDGDGDAPFTVAASSEDGSTTVTVRRHDGAAATATAGADGRLHVRVRAGDPLDEVVLRSYVIGAAHQALGWVTAEAIAVDEEGVVHDLTIRSFGILRSSDMPPVDVVVESGEGPAVNGSDLAFVAVAAAVWIAQGMPPVWPTRLAWPPSR